MLLLQQLLLLLQQLLLLLQRQTHQLLRLPWLLLQWGILPLLLLLGRSHLLVLC